MVLYKDIEPEIRPFLQIDEEGFNQLPEGVRNVLKDGARVQWLNKGSPAIDSIRYPMIEQHDRADFRNMDLNDFTDFYYEKHITRSTVGVEVYRFTLRNSFNIPTPWEYINVVQHQFNKLHGTNATLRYISNDDMPHHLCFSKNDMERYTTEQLFDKIRQGSETWHDNGLYSGSSRIKNAFITYRLHTEQFDIIVKSTEGGYGKMIPDYYDVLGLENNEDDCLIRCFIHIYEQEGKNNVYTIDVIRNYLKKQGKLGLKAIPLLEEFFHVKVSVVKDYRDIDIEYECPDLKDLRNIPPYTAFKAKILKDREVYIHGDHKRKWKLLHKDEHYDVVTRTYLAKECLCPHTGVLLPRRKPYNKKQLKRKIIERYYVENENLTLGGLTDDENEKDIYYYFFDYETVFEQTSMEIIPYAYAIVKCDHKFNIIEERYKIGMDCNRDLSNYLFSEAPKQDEIKYLIGYNNSRFDNFILLKYALLNNNYVGHTRFAGNTIISANVSNFAVRDLCRILNMPLDVACKAFKIELPKLTGAVQHHEVQFMYMEGEDKFNKYLMQSYNTIKDYVIRDCVSLSQLYKLTKATMDELVGLDLNEHYTLAGMSYVAFKSTINTNELPILNNGYLTEDKKVREAIIGGRAQMQCIEGKDMCAIDCVSLYPYVMLNREYPIGYPISTDVYVLGKIGVYDVQVISQVVDKLNIVPLRCEQLDWNHKGEIECVLCSVDIESLRRHGGVINIKKGFYWEENRSDLFDQYFKNLIEDKKRQDVLKEKGSDEYNPARRETDKLKMNGLSGKLAQRLYNIETEIVKNTYELDRFFNKTIKGSQTLIPLGNSYIARGNIEPLPSMPCIYGVLIYAYAREHMYESVLKYLKPEELYGMDTDSAFITQQCFERIPKTLIGNDFGQFKIELSNVSGIFIAPKCYCFYKENKIVKARFKGVKVGKDVEIEEEIDNPIELYRYYHSQEAKKVDVDTFRRFMKDKEINIVCCNIEKYISNNVNALYLGNHTFVKKLVVKENNIENVLIDKEIVIDDD